MIRIGLAGGRGYVGEELVGLISGIPDYEIVYVGSRSSAGKPLTAGDPDLQDPPCDLVFRDLSPESIRDCQADAWVIARPNGEAAALVDLIAPSQAKIVDISSDYRFDEQWTYGLPERYAEVIRTSTRIANPGCYATATQLAILPLAGRLAGTPQAFGISGFSGAGRTPSEKNDPERLARNILPYALADHLHQREVTRQLGRDVRLTPHVAAFFRGITMTVNMELQQATSGEELAGWFSDHYAACPLVQVGSDIPEIRQVAGTNRGLVGGFAVDPRDARRVTVVSVIDNLRKGAASQAIQNLNLMFGMESEKGLLA